LSEEDIEIGSCREWPSGDLHDRRRRMTVRISRMKTSRFRDLHDGLGRKTVRISSDQDNAFAGSPCLPIGGPSTSTSATVGSVVPLCSDASMPVKLPDHHERRITLHVQLHATQ